MRAELEREYRLLADDLLERGASREELLHACEGIRTYALSLGVPLTLAYSLAHKLAIDVEGRSPALAIGAPWRKEVRL